MTTLRLFALNRLSLEASTAWYLNDLGELRGKQELYTQQSPQRLKALRESAIIESALSSNRIEGVTIDPQRVRAILVAPRPLFRDGNGRVSRLLWLLQSAQLGYEVGRYISLERLVEQNKERYYEKLARLA